MGLPRVRLLELAVPGDEFAALVHERGAADDEESQALVSDALPRGTLVVEQGLVPSGLGPCPRRSAPRCEP